MGVAGNCQKMTCLACTTCSCLAAGQQKAGHLDISTHIKAGWLTGPGSQSGDANFPVVHKQPGQLVSILRQQTSWECNQSSSQWTFSSPDFYWHLVDSCHLQQFPSPGSPSLQYPNPSSCLPSISGIMYTSLYPHRPYSHLFLIGPHGCSTRI